MLVGEELVELSHDYSNLQQHPAWQHFQGLLWSLKENLQVGILQGVVEGERDLTPQHRAMYGLLLQILAIPGQIEVRKIAAEHDAGFRTALEERSELDNLLNTP